MTLVNYVTIEFTTVLYSITAVASY